MKKAPIKIEIGNIPDEFHASAIASILALVKLEPWVFVPLGNKKSKAFKFDLRFGKEAELSDDQLFNEFGAVEIVEEIRKLRSVE